MLLGLPTVRFTNEEVQSAPLSYVKGLVAICDSLIDTLAGMNTALTCILDEIDPNKFI